MGLTFNELRQAADRANERLQRGFDAEQEPPPETIEIHWVRISSTTKTDSRYPGHRYTRDGAANTFTEAETCWVYGPNGMTLATGIYYPAKLAGVKADDGLAIYDAVSSSECSFSGAKAAISSTVTLPWDSLTTIPLGLEIFDTGSYHSPANTSILIAPEHGTYSIIGSVSITGGSLGANGSTGSRQVEIWGNIDGSDTRLQGVTSSGDTYFLNGHDQTLSVHVQLGAGDYVFLRAWQKMDSSDVMDIADASLSIIRLSCAGAATAGGAGSGSGGSGFSSGNCCTDIGGSALPSAVATVTNAAGRFGAVPSSLNFASEADPNNAGKFRWDCTTAAVTDWYIDLCSNVDGVPQILLIGYGTTILAENGYVCDTFSAVFSYDDGAGNSITITVLA